jgi:hypothetical protein
LVSVFARAPGQPGRVLSEKEETELDEAQHRARLRASLSLSEAAHLYRRAREAAHSARGTLCSSGDELPRELHRHQRPVGGLPLKWSSSLPTGRRAGLHYSSRATGDPDRAHGRFHIFISRAWRAALARALEQLPEILQKDGASMKSQFDGFAEYVGAERNAIN